MLLVARAARAASADAGDEVTEGLQPSVIERLAATLRSERGQFGTTMLLIEQNLSFALSWPIAIPR